MKASSDDLLKELCDMFHQSELKRAFEKLIWQRDIPRLSTRKSDSR